MADSRRGSARECLRDYAGTVTNRPRGGVESVEQPLPRLQGRLGDARVATLEKCPLHALRKLHLPPEFEFDVLRLRPTFHLRDDGNARLVCLRELRLSGAVPA